MNFSRLNFFGLVFLSVASVSCSKKPEATNPMMAMMMAPAPVRAVAAVESDVPLGLNAVGNVETMASVDVKSRVAGPILRVLFTEGQNVGKGQLLFEIDPEPLQRQIAQTQADLVKDQALEQQARANVLKDQANIKQTQASADRATELAKEGIYSKEQTEQLVASNAASLAGLEADRAAVESAMAATKSDSARLAQTQLQLGYTKITAPIAGRAGAVQVKAGNLVKDNDTTLVNLVQLAPIYVTFGIPEQMLPDVRKYNGEHPLEVEAVTNDGQSMTGQLRFIDNTVDMTTGAIKLKAEFANANHVLWPGQFVNVNARIRLEKDRILVPASAIENGPQGKYVWVIDKGAQTAAMRPVNVLRNYKPAQQAEQAVIASGLQPGEMVVTEGQMRLMPGGKVHLLEGAGAQVGAAAQGSAGGAE